MCPWGHGILRPYIGVIPMRVDVIPGGPGAQATRNINIQVENRRDRIPSQVRNGH